MIKNLTKKYFSGSVLMGSILVANAINLIYQALLGRFIHVEEFGVITLITNLFYILNIFLNALAATVNYLIANHIAQNQTHKSHGFIYSLTHQLFKVNLLVSVLWILSIPFLTNFFHLKNSLVLILFTPLFLFYPVAAISRGLFQGQFLFIKSAFLTLIEPATKLITVLILLFYEWHSWAYLSLYISVFVTGAVSYALMFWNKPGKGNESDIFPHKFYLNAVLNGLSTISFLAIDVILVKHYLSPVAAGQYSLLSLVGKTIYFLGTLMSVFIISITSKEITSPRKRIVPFHYLLLGSFVLSLAGYVAFGIFGWFFTPLLFGPKAHSVVPYSSDYVLAFLFFTVGSMIVTYHLAKKQYIFTIVATVLSALVACGIIVFHRDLGAVVNSIFYTSMAYFGVLFLMHIKQNFFTVIPSEVEGSFSIEHKNRL